MALTDTTAFSAAIASESKSYLFKLQKFIDEYVLANLFRNWVQNGYSKRQKKKKQPSYSEKKNNFFTITDMICSTDNQMRQAHKSKWGEIKW